jgi:hypothetical protein
MHKQLNSLFANRRRTEAIGKLACAALLTTTTALCASDPDGVTLINQASLLAAGTPYTITQAGSYRLSSNLGANSIVISIQAANVTLDLNGFSILTTASGIISNGPGTAILNGFVTGLGAGKAMGNGLTFYQPTARVDHVTVSNFSTGIAGTSDLTVSNSTVSANGNWGIDCDGGSLVVSNSIVSGNYTGIGAGGTAALLTGNTIAGSTLHGVNIHATGTGATVTNNTILGNGGAGVATAGITGIGSNTFAGNRSGDWIGVGPVSMKNNVCGGGTVC